MLVRVGEFSEVVVAGSKPGDVQLLQRRGLVIFICPPDGQPLEVAVALEVRPGHRLLRVPRETGELDVDEAERGLESAAISVPPRQRRGTAHDLERRDCRLVPMVVFGVEERYPGRMSLDDPAGAVEYLLGRNGALLVVDAVDVAGAT